MLKCIYHKRSTHHVENAIQFKMDNWVLADRRNLLITTVSNKSLSWTWLGPYKSITGIGTYAYRLERLNCTRWHDEIHTTLRKPFRWGDEPQDIDENEKDIWEVKSIVNSRTIKRVVLYQVRCTSCPGLDYVWKTFDHLNYRTEKLQEFLQKFHKKPHDEGDVSIMANIWIWIHVDMVPFTSS